MSSKMVQLSEYITSENDFGKTITSSSKGGPEHDEDPFGKKGVVH